MVPLELGLLLESRAYINAWAHLCCQAPRFESSVGFHLGQQGEGGLTSVLEDLGINFDGLVYKLFTEMFL